MVVEVFSKVVQEGWWFAFTFEEPSQLLPHSYMQFTLINELHQKSFHHLHITCTQPPVDELHLL